MAITSTISKTSYADNSAAWYVARYSAVLADYPSAAFLTGFATPGILLPEPCKVYGTEKIKDASVRIQVSRSSRSQIEAGIGVWTDLTVDSGGAGTNTKAGKDEMPTVNGIRAYFASALAASTYDFWVICIPANDEATNLRATPEGGWAQVVLSDTGADSVYGQILTTGTATASMKINPTSGKSATGTTLIAGVPTGGYILVNPLIGVGPVLTEAATAVVLGQIFSCSTVTAGRVKSIAEPAYAAADIVLRIGFPIIADAGGANVVVMAQLGY
jgi:hypothetical protein